MANVGCHLRRLWCVLALVGCLALLAACDTGGGAQSGTPTAAPLTLTVGGEAGTENELLTKMYVLLLKHAGLNVVEYAAMSTNDEVFKALTSGKLDLSPEFTATGLLKLNLNSTGNAQQDYLQVKQGYEDRYHITWLDIAPLNNTYGICTTAARASSLKLSKISDLTGQAADLSVASTSAGAKDGLAILQRAYGLTFQEVIPYQTEDQAFQAVSSGAQDLNICSATSPELGSGKSVFLRDDKNAFPACNPAPIVRNTALKKEPRLVSILNKLAPFVTTQASRQWQSQVASGQSITAVATSFLQSKGLL